MRLSLGRPIAADRAAAIKAVTADARAAHAAHEDAGGYPFDYVLFLSGKSPMAADVTASLNRHLEIQSARQAALAQINAAAHGVAIAAAVTAFSTAIATKKVSS